MLSDFSASILSSDFRKLAFMTYGKRLKLALERAGRDRASLATELGVSVQAVGQVITGGRSGTQTFTASNNVKAAKFLRVDPHWLATGDGEMQSESTWPFVLLTQKQAASLNSSNRETVEMLALRLLSSQPGNVLSDVSHDENESSSSQVQPATPRRPIPVKRMAFRTPGAEEDSAKRSQPEGIRARKGRST